MLNEKAEIALADAMANLQAALLGMSKTPGGLQVLKGIAEAGKELQREIAKLREAA